MLKLLAIWGAGGHAGVVADIVRRIGQYEIAGFLDDAHPDRAGEPFSGSTVLGGREQLEALLGRGVGHCIVAVGDCRARLRIAEDARRAGFTLATAIHPRSTIASTAVIGAGTIAAAGSVVNPSARVGENAIVNTCASVDHDCVIEDGVHVGPGAHLGGGVRVGRGTHIGIGAAVVDGARIGEGSIIGAGAVVVDDVPDRVVAVGVPARVIRGLDAA